LGVEVFGATDAAVDAEVLALAMSFFTSLGVECRLHINSVGTTDCRTRYREALKAYVEPSLANLSEEGQMRFQVNPLRMLDTKDQRDLAILAGAPALREFLSEESSLHFQQLQDYLTALAIPFRIDDGLVRGFDYYSGTVFEIKGEGLGAQDALGGGGRYDGLVEECGGAAVPGLGFGIGMERCLLALEALGIAPNQEDEAPVAFIITAGSQQEVKTAAVKLLYSLRTAGIAADMDYQGKNFRRQFKRADDVGTRFYIIIGEDEAAKGTVQLKDRASGEQREFDVESVAETLRTGRL
jgi:histidyl-tRNA synthetase